MSLPLVETANPRAALRVVDSGLGASVQDRGRRGWRRFGVPVSGWMDGHAAESANRLLDNPANLPVVECLLQGAVFEALRDVWLALCGAELEVNIPMWRAHLAKEGEIIRLARVRTGMWSYLAVEGGLDWESAFGSASYYARGGIGRALEPGTVLPSASRGGDPLPRGVSGRFVPPRDLRNYDHPPKLTVWKGPQWNSFSTVERARFFEISWEVSPESDRAGYRLRGGGLKADAAEMASEPVRVGSIQVPGSGEPIVTMPDGPTVGGYPKIAVVDAESLPWLAQCRPGKRVSFRLGDED